MKRLHTHCLRCRRARSEVRDRFCFALGTRYGSHKYTWHCEQGDRLHGSVNCDDWHVAA